ncbi:hypothetical protein B0T18DRAFT_72240 [Schizothecium vesticola]|uniref:Uncharacterized protein n=1 Tax=Schizothecium vesticola TaxID=314040 RepID=A0AA40F5J5_9PEZI|nr:hypothetical protein B0T18DRAFT_72240 [Schizothecium vesticola]
MCRFWGKTMTFHIWRNRNLGSSIILNLLKGLLLPRYPQLRSSESSTPVPTLYPRLAAAPFFPSLAKPKRHYRRLVIFRKRKDVEVLLFFPVTPMPISMSLPVGYRKCHELGPSSSLRVFVERQCPPPPKPPVYGEFYAHINSEPKVRRPTNKERTRV